jgi:hypothetical protein
MAHVMAAEVPMVLNVVMPLVMGMDGMTMVAMQASGFGGDRVEGQKRAGNSEKGEEFEESFGWGHILDLPCTAASEDHGYKKSIRHVTNSKYGTPRKTAALALRHLHACNAAGQITGTKGEIVTTPEGGGSSAASFVLKRTSWMARKSRMSA